MPRTHNGKLYVNHSPYYYRNRSSSMSSSGIFSSPLADRMITRAIDQGTRRLFGGTSEETEEQTVAQVGGQVGTGKSTGSAFRLRLHKYSKPPSYGRLSAGMKYIHSFNGTLGKNSAIGYDQWQQIGTLFNFDMLFSHTSVAPGAVASAKRNFSTLQAPLFNLLQPEAGSNTVGGLTGAYGGTSMTWSTQNATDPTSASGSLGQIFGKAYLSHVGGEIWFQNYAQQITEVTLYIVTPKFDAGNSKYLDALAWYNNVATRENLGSFSSNKYSTGETTSQYGLPNFSTSGSTTLLNPHQDIWDTKIMHKAWHVHKQHKFDLQPGHSHKVNFQLLYNKYIDVSSLYARCVNNANADINVNIPNMTTHFLVRMRSAPVWDGTASAGLTYGPCDVRFVGTYQIHGKYIKPTETTPRNIYVDPSIPEFTITTTTVAPTPSNNTLYPTGGTVVVPAAGTGIQTPIVINP